MLSYLLYVVSLVNGHSGFVDRFVDRFVDSNLETQLKEVEMAGETSGGLVVKMGPVMNLRVADVRVFPAGGELPVMTQKGSLFEGFSHSRLYAIHYGK